MFTFGIAKRLLVGKSVQLAIQEWAYFMNEMNATWVLYLLGKFWLDEYKLNVRLFNSQDLK